MHLKIKKAGYVRAKNKFEFKQGRRRIQFNIRDICVNTYNDYSLSVYWSKIGSLNK